MTSLFKAWTKKPRTSDEILEKTTMKQTGLDKILVKLTVTLLTPLSEGTRA